MAGVREKLLTASDLAALCEVDLKTIHNWVDRGRIAHFRTPGRHLRFRAADVAEFLRAWGYTVPRELARASARSVLVIGAKDTLAHVSRAVGEGAVAAAAAGGGAVAGSAAAGASPVRHATHPYDALVYAGSDPADVYVIDPKALVGEVDVDAMLEALHRASPQAIFVVLSDDPAGVPAFATRVGRGDAQALKALLAPGENTAAGLPPVLEEVPRGIAASGSR